MSTNFKCPYCHRYLSSRNAYSQHMTLCIEHYCDSTEESNEDSLRIISSENEMLIDSEDFSHIEEPQVIRGENLPPISENIQLISEVSYHYESDSNYAGDISFASDISFAGMSHSSNIPEEYENFDEILPESLQILPESLQSLPGYNEESEVENIKEFPNEAYADLMTLVTENNLSNKAENAIIKFFNKHSDLSRSPLPKSIETGQKFMDKMNISHLSYSKHCILKHNNQEYFINYRPIKNCIENLLSNPEISRHFIFKYKNMKVICT